MTDQERFRPPIELVRRGLDVLGAGVALVALSPVLAIAALAIRVTMGSPVLFHEVRAGRGGEPFELLKFRTMRPLRDGETIPESDAQRITRVGRLLRASSVDELPSLVNVLRGEMGLVGPRPLPVRYVERFSPEQARRLEVAPGLTGWAQVNGRNSTSWAERFALDVWYVDHRSMRLDLHIIALTLRGVVTRAGISHEGHATMPEFQGAPGKVTSTDRSVTG